MWGDGGIEISRMDRHQAIRRTCLLYSQYTSSLKAMEKGRSTSILTARSLLSRFRKGPSTGRIIGDAAGRMLVEISMK